MSAQVYFRSNESAQIESVTMLMDREMRTVAVPQSYPKPSAGLRCAACTFWSGLVIIAVILIFLIGLLAWSLFAEGVEAPPSRDYSADIQRLFEETNTRAPQRRRTTQFTRHANNKTYVIENPQNEKLQKNNNEIFDEVDMWLERGSDAQKTAVLHRLRVNMSALCARSWQCKLRLAIAQYFDAIAFSDRNPNSPRDYRAALDVANATATAAWRLAPDRPHRLLTMFAVIDGTMASSSSYATDSEKLDIGIRTFVWHQNICLMIFFSCANTVLKYS